MEECRILTILGEVEAIRPEWADLCARRSSVCFSDFETIDGWMQTVGKLEKTTYHIVTVRREGRLTGVLPLVVTKKRGLRLMRWVGHDVFLGAVQVFETEADRKALWRTALASPHYDVAKIKYLFAGTPEREMIMAQKGVQITETYPMTYTDLNGQSGEAWLATLSGGTRRDYKRKKNALARQGEIALKVWDAGHIPYDKLDQMMGFKKGWANEGGHESGIFLSDTFMPAIVRVADAKGSVYLHDLTCGGETVALSVNFVHNNILYWYMTTRHPKWHRFSVGSLSLVETILWAAEQGFKRVHLMEGPSAYKAHFMNGSQDFDTGLWGKTFKGRLATLAAKLLRRKAA